MPFGATWDVVSGTLATMTVARSATAKARRSSDGVWNLESVSLGDDDDDDNDEEGVASFSKAEPKVSKAAAPLT